MIAKTTQTYRGQQIFHVFHKQSPIKTEWALLRESKGIIHRGTWVACSQVPPHAPPLLQWSLPGEPRPHWRCLCPWPGRELYAQGQRNEAKGEQRTTTGKNQKQGDIERGKKRQLTVVNVCTLAKCNYWVQLIFIRSKDWIWFNSPRTMIPAHLRGTCNTVDPWIYVRT